MHVKTKMMAFGGLLLALCVLCMALGSVFETGTLFFLATGSYFVGIVIREMGMKMGVAFYLAAVLLGVILAPNKFYVLTFAAMGFYITAVEGMWRLLAKGPGKVQRRGIFFGMKFVLFNLMYIPLVVFFQEILFSQKLSGGMAAAVLIGGQILLWIYDNAYEYFQGHVWPGFRGRLFKIKD